MIAVGGGGALILALLFLTLFCWPCAAWLGAPLVAGRQRRRAAPACDRPPAVTMFGQKPILLSDLQDATEHFGSDRVLSSGPLGTVYKALFPDGTVLSVRKLPPDPAACSASAFQAEAKKLGALKSGHLVPLLGCSALNGERLLLYAYMPRGSLATLLHGMSNQRRRSRRANQWSLRSKVALGAAQGLAFLHHECSPPLVHCALEPGCILLDSFYEPRIVGAGVAQLVAAPSSGGLMPGAGALQEYGPPEYRRGARPSPSGDVYSYGKILLELLTGRRPGDPADEAVRLAIAEGNFGDVIDRRLDSTKNEDEMLELLKVAMLCVAESPEARPSMADVVDMVTRAKEMASRMADMPPEQ